MARPQEAHNAVPSTDVIRLSSGLALPTAELLQLTQSGM